MTTRFVERPGAQRIVFGAGELANLADHAAGLQVRRVLLCTSPSYARNGAAERARAALDGRPLAVFDAARPHVPEAAVAEALRLAEEAGADAIVALGGGSAIGTGKAVAAALADRRAAPPALIAVPTTYAGSEMTPVYGVTRAGRKVTTSDPRVLPALVVYDPELTRDLPPEVIAGTGANALAHAVEATYSLQGTPLATAAALAAAGRIAAALPRLLRDVGDQDQEARETMLVGAYLAGVALSRAGMALHHAICHALGGGAGVPHGTANAIILPHALRFNGPVAVAALAAVGRALGVPAATPDPAAAGAAIAQIAVLLDGLPLPHRLRDAGVPADALPRLAAETLVSPSLRANPRPIADADEIEGILRAAW